jgi:hypothetical protein
MIDPRPDDEVELARLLERQRRLAWDFEKAVPWEQGIDLERYFVPLDKDALIFPGASPEQRLAISQYLGLVIAQTFGEMETALVSAKELVWERNIKRWPVNPEFEAFGLQFFSEEEKHSRMFKRFLRSFALQTGIAPEELSGILPIVPGTVLHRALKLNTDAGGHALWWVLTLVEEVSVLIYKQLRPFKGQVDPLYFALHRRHFEEEVRHSPYSIWMLDHLYRHSRFPVGLVFRKTDLALAQALEIVWTFSSLCRVLKARSLRRKHPFYAALASCTPLLLRQSPVRAIQKLFVNAPYVSLLLNPRTCSGYQSLISRLHAVPLPTPDPKPADLTCA